MKRAFKSGILFIFLTLTGIARTQPLEDLPQAIRKGDVKEVRALLREGDQDYLIRAAEAFRRSRRGAPLLILAAKLVKAKADDSKMAKITKELLRYETDPTVKDRSGMTPLMWAAKNNAYKVLKALLRNKKAQDTINTQDRIGNTALIYATMIAGADASDNSVKAVETLLKKDANPNIRNIRGKTAFFYAEQASNTRIKDLLLRYRKKWPMPTRPRTRRPRPRRWRQKPITKSITVRPIEITE